MEMKILVTGGLGFIGSNLIKLLITKTKIKQIIIVDNQSKSDLKYLDTICKYKYFNSPKEYRFSTSKVVVVKANTKDNIFAKLVTKNIDAVIHLAAESGVDLNILNPRKAFEINIQGTYNFLDACRINNVKNFIFASSGSVFGDAEPPMKENTSKRPISTYGSSKLAIESFCETYAKIFNIKTTVLRFSNAYGPFSKHKKSVVANFSKNIMSGKSLIINGDGSNTRDYIHVDDIATAIYKSFNQKNYYENFNVSTGKETSINQLIKMMFNIFKKHGYQKCFVKYSKPRVGDMKYNSMDSRKYLKHHNISRLIDIKLGLKKTINWFIKNS